MATVKLWTDEDAAAQMMPIVYEDEDDDYAEKPSLIFVDRSEMAALLAGQDVILSF